MMDSINETQSDLQDTRAYQSPVIRTHRRDELAAKAMPINACTSYDELGLDGV